MFDVIIGIYFFGAVISAMLFAINRASLDNDLRGIAYWIVFWPVVMMVAVAKSIIDGFRDHVRRKQ